MQNCQYMLCNRQFINISMPYILITTLTLLYLLHYSNTHSIPITRHQASLKQDPSCTSVGPNNQTIIGFGNCGNNLYYINVNIGTSSPQQTLGLQFDTGSNTLWVPTQLVASQNTIFFNTSLSSTFTNTSNPGSITYVDQSGVSGTYGTDVFQLQNSLINIVTQYLWVTSQNGMTYPTDTVQGLVGMGFTDIPNFLDVAYQNNQIATAAFALQILDNSQQSLIHYNELPQSISNSTIYSPIFGDSYWEVEVLGMTVGGIDMTSSAADNAVIDSGTSFFYLNPDLYSSVVSQFFSNCQNVGGSPMCSCSGTNWPTFAFAFYGVEVYIEPDQYKQVISNDVCTFLFGSISSISEILLGDIFFRSYIITFDKENSQIGFSGNTQALPVISSSLNNALGWGLMGLLGVIVLFGFAVACCLESDLNDALDNPNGVIFPQFQLANSSRLRARLY